MAYYSSSFYEDDHGDYTASEYYYSYSTPFYNSYEPALVQDSVTYSSYNFNDYQSLNCDPAPYSSPTCKIAYSASIFGQPDHIYHDPDPYYSAKTHFIVSYSVSDFGEPEFDDYDPTPYDGGYDITATYGKPLPPSDQICYPRSTPDPNAFSSNGVPSGLITAALGNENVHENAADPTRESPQVSADDAKKQPSEYDNRNDGNSLEIHGDYETGHANGTSGDQDDYVSGKRAPPIPSGYGLEAVDICESLFGYWPCLLRNGRTTNEGREVADNHYGSNYGNPWQNTADYLFGSSNPYGEKRDSGGDYGNAVYGYQRHYEEQPGYQLVEYVEDSGFAYSHLTSQF